VRYFCTMKFILASIFLVQITLPILSQCDTLRYVSSVFEEINVLENIEYGTAPQWNFPNLNESLVMDVYSPEEDDLTMRPCMIWAHPGGFLLGDKQADDMVALCDSFARRGYVTASINYRKGFNPIDANSSERAVYRGFQDGRAAYRYLVENHELYGIDTTKIFIGGSSAGALIAHHVSFMEEDERPESTFEQLLAPDLGCIDCTGNTFNHEVNPIGNIALWGAIGDTSWVDNNTPTLMVHGTADAVVPYNVGPPFELFTLPDVFGSLPIYEKLIDIDSPVRLESVLGAGHEPHGTNNGYWSENPNDYWFEMFEVIEEFSFDLIRPNAPEIIGEEFVCKGLSSVFSVELNPGETVCWQVNGGSFEEISSEEVLITLTQENAIISAVITNEIGAASITSNVHVAELPELNVNWESALEGNTLSLIAFTSSAVQWFINESPISTDSQVSVNLLSSGKIEIKLIVTDEFGCETTFTEGFLFVHNNLIEEDENVSSLTLKGNLLEVFSSAPSILNIYSMNGQLISRTRFPEGVSLIPAPHGINVYSLMTNYEVITKTFYNY